MPWSESHQLLPGGSEEGSQLGSVLIDHQERGRPASSCLKWEQTLSRQESPGVLVQPSRELVSDSGAIPRAAYAVATS